MVEVAEIVITSLVYLGITVSHMLYDGNAVENGHKKQVSCVLS